MNADWSMRSAAVPCRLLLNSDFELTEQVPNENQLRMASWFHAALKIKADTLEEPLNRLPSTQNPGAFSKAWPIVPAGPYLDAYAVGPGHDGVVFQSA